MNFFLPYAFVECRILNTITIIASAVVCEGSNRLNSSFIGGRTVKSKPSSTVSIEIDKSATVMSDDARPSHFFVSSKKVSVNLTQLSERHFVERQTDFLY